MHRQALLGVLFINSKVTTAIAALNSSLFSFGLGERSDLLPVKDPVIARKETHLAVTASTISRISGQNPCPVDQKRVGTRNHGLVVPFPFSMLLCVRLGAISQGSLWHGWVTFRWVKTVRTARIGGRPETQDAHSRRPSLG